MKSKCIVCDIDGCLSDSKEMVNTCITKEGFNRYKANKLMPTMKVNSWADWICNMGFMTHELFIVTARRNSSRTTTEQWLKNNNILYTKLYTKPDEAKERDEEYKLRMIKALEEKYEILFIVDDSPKVVSLLRNNGYWVLQPNNLY